MRARSALNEAFERAGFQLVRSNGHNTWRCPCGHRQVYAASTPGKGRAFKNIQAEIARTLRACQRTRSIA